MTIESTEELRERLLRDHEVQEMIRMRAYEIYRHRGGAPGGHAEDWFQAESVEAAPKKPRARKAKAKAADAVEGAAKKTTRRAATKNPDSTAKPKRSRKKSTDVTPTE